MPARGQVYSLKRILPPGQQQHHRIVVLSPTTLMSSSGNNLFVMAAIIRSGITKKGERVRPVPGHSIPLPGGTIPGFDSDGFVETHQQFPIPLIEFKGHQPISSLPPPIMEQVLAGCRRLYQH